MPPIQMPPRRYVILGICICIAAFLGLAQHTTSKAPSTFSAASAYYPMSTWGKKTVLGQGEPIVFSLICFGNETVYETDILLKVSRAYAFGLQDESSDWQTVLMYSSSPVDFHLIADPVSQAYLENSFSLIKSPAVPIRIYFYPITNDAMQ